jgi:2-keto-4-pentenoate hydratase/2-oxohepta-3-ene-1,7-dioic acid hydratase in catechol pathway
MTFRLLSYSTPDNAIPRAGILIGDDRIVDAATAFAEAGHVPNVDAGSALSIIQAWDKSLPILSKIAAVGANRQSLALADVRLAAPLLYPLNIYCAAANYQDHFREMSGKDVDKTTINPYFFLKVARQTVVGTGAQIRRPKVVQKLDWEAEIAAVIGRGGRNISADKALDHVAGYTIINDLSARDYIRRTDWPNLASDWLWQKSFDTSAPMGPWITPADQIRDPQNLYLKTWVNDTLKQDTHSKHMVFTVREQIVALSQHFTLLPGDVIATGTGSGVGHPHKTYMNPGDVCRIEIEGLGTITNTVVQGE